jgi:hypothetical protein
MREDGPGRRVAAWTALVLGVAGLVTAGYGLARQVMPRHFTPAQQQAISAWQVGTRWRAYSAGRMFPASIGYQLPDTVVIDNPSLTLYADRVAIAPQATCRSAVASTRADAALGQAGCEAVLRATYEDETKSFLMTVSVAVLPSASAATTVAPVINAALAEQQDGFALTANLAGWRSYDYNRQLSSVLTAGPYLVLYSAGYADGRPRVQLGHDTYSQAEISSMANGVAQSVAGTLDTAPPVAHCPGSPGC